MSRTPGQQSIRRQNSLSGLRALPPELLLYSYFVPLHMAVLARWPISSGVRSSLCVAKDH